MSWVAASVGDTNATCEAGTSTIVAFRALGHQPLQRRRDRVVLGTELVPARQRLPPTGGDDGVAETQWPHRAAVSPSW